LKAHPGSVQTRPALTHALFQVRRICAAGKYLPAFEAEMNANDAFRRAELMLGHGGSF
jgi:hypothetical protein